MGHSWKRLAEILKRLSDAAEHGLADTTTEDHTQASLVQAYRLPTDTATVQEQQKVLVLDAIRQPYRLECNYAVPKIQKSREVLVRNAVIGLNPIDWKAP